MFRKLTELERLDMRERLAFGEAGNVCDGGARAGADDDVLRSKGAAASAVERDFDRLRSDEVSRAENEFHAGLTEALLMHRDETVHHAAFARAHRCHIDAGLRRMEAEGRCLRGGVRDLRGVDHALTREACDVGTGAANVTAFDQRGLAAGGCQIPGDVFAGLSTAENEYIALFHLRLRAGRGG